MRLQRTPFDHLGIDAHMAAEQSDSSKSLPFSQEGGVCYRPRSKVHLKEEMMTKRLAIFVSGTGSIMEAIFVAGIPVELVFADRECAALQKAQARGIHTKRMDRAGYFGPTTGFDREGFTMAIARTLHSREIDIVMMAGFMSFLHKCFFKEYEGAIINTHPSLLPAFKGDHAVRDAFNAGVKVTGCTMHYATEVLDSGEIIDQRVVWRKPDDSIESLHERIKVEERQMVPENLRRIIAD
jgi:phosphoribosylglycinamide formyltransferase-1